MKNLVIALMLLFTVSCTDAWWGKVTSYGDSASVKCYSGSTIIYEGESSGKVISEETSDGYYFVDKATGDTMEVSGNCVITYD